MAFQNVPVIVWVLYNITFFASIISFFFLRAPPGTVVNGKYQVEKKADRL